MMKKITDSSVVVFWLLLALGCSSGPEAQPLAGPYYEGDGGAGIRIAVLEPVGVNLAQRDLNAELTRQIQADLTVSLQRYSAMTVLDRANQDAIEAERVRSEQNYSEEERQRRVEELKARVIVTGMLTRIPNGAYILVLTCTEKEPDVILATVSLPNLSASALYGMVPLRQAAAELLASLGVKLSPSGRAALQVVPK
jgi:hypothetical protein